MNTTAKGDKFESLVFEALKQELVAERLGLLPKSCEIFRKKGYFSRDRNSDIVVDISIEVTQPGADTYSFLWVCECKDYYNSIPVDDVEEFNDKLRQIAGKNVKGVIAIHNGSIQPAAYSVAKANGIGIIRILPDDQVQWTLRAMVLSESSHELKPSDFVQAITRSNFEGVNRSFYAISDGYILDNWYSLLKRTLRTL
jgi:hypothetical protein